MKVLWGVCVCLWNSCRVNVIPDGVLVNFAENQSYQSRMGEGCILKIQDKCCSRTIIQQFISESSKIFSYCIEYIELLSINTVLLSECFQHTFKLYIFYLKLKLKKKKALIQLSKIVSNEFPQHSVILMAVLGYPSSRH